MLTVTNVIGSLDFERKIDLINALGTGISERNSDQSLMIYPNPTLNETTISINKSNRVIKSASLFNSSGQKVMEYLDLDTEQLFITKDKLVSGVYFIYLKLDTGEIISRKIVFK